jgi:hypothetical protein
MTKVGLYAIGKSTTLESNKSHPERRQHKLPPFYQCTRGQVILDLRVIKLSRVWQEVHRRYLASKPMPVVHLETAKGPQNKQLAA